MYCLDGALVPDVRIKAQQPNRDARVIQVDGSVVDALLHRFGQSLHIDVQADRECRDRADGGTDDFVHAQLISPLDLIAERVVAEYLPAFLDQCRVARRQARVGPCIDRADRSGQQCNAAGNQPRERLHLEFHRVTLRSPVASRRFTPTRRGRNPVAWPTRDIGSQTGKSSATSRRNMLNIAWPAVLVLPALPDAAANVLPVAGPDRE